MVKRVWVEKYRPQKVSDVIVKNERDREKFDHYVKEGSFPNILFEGGAGTGKSSMSNALVKSIGINKLDVLKINCSHEKIDAMRDKVMTFSMTMPLGDFKVVRLEELDGIGHEAQKLLRDVIETTEKSCRFIATCNYTNLLLAPLRSRFQEYQFYAPSKDEVLVRSAEILEAENVTFDIDDLEKTVEAGYPDFRKIIQLLESNSIGGTLRIDGGGSAGDWKLGLLPLLEAGNLTASRKLICETASPAELVEVYGFLYRNIHRLKKLKQKDEAVIQLADYQKHHPNAYDKELHIAALFAELERCFD